MPFLNGKFYMNPAQGRAIERARDQQHLDPPDASSHWVTIHGHHVLIHEPQTGQAQHKPRRRMSLSSNGLDFIKKHEAFRDRMYLDSAGNPTIGYGHKIGPGEDFSKGITEKQALELLNHDINRAAGEVNAALKVPADQNQFDALVSLAYNAGPVSVAVNNEVMRAVNAGRVSERNFTAYDLIRVKGRYVVSQGLLNRRKAEYKMFSGGGR